MSIAAKKIFMPPFFVSRKLPISGQRGGGVFSQVLVASGPTAEFGSIYNLYLSLPNIPMYLVITYHPSKVQLPVIVKGRKTTSRS